MSKSKHTKGPWKTQGTAVWTNTNGVPFLVAEVTKPSSKSNSIDWKANAALIAAAPEMLEALEALVSDYSIEKKDLDPNLHEDALIITALSVLAKAKGDQS